MTFTPNIPASGQTLGASRPQIVQNFTNYNDTLSQDHVSPNSAGQGKHNKSTYVAQGSDPTTLANEACLYQRTGPSGSEIFMIRDNIAGTKVNLTTSKIAAPTNAATGVSWLPGGILIQWGIKNFTGLNQAVVVNFPAIFPNSCYNVQCIGIGFANSFAVSFVSTSVFTADRYQVTSAGIGSNQQFYWLAIGS